MKQMKTITEYYGDGDHKGLRSIVEQGDGIYSVAFFKDDKFKGEMMFPDKSLRYVEDAAENYTLGILEFNNA